MASDFIEQSLAFNHSHRIAEDQPILFGMRDGGRHLQFGNDGEPVGMPFREIVVARSPDEDPDLKAAIDTAVAATSELSSRLEKADYLADYVAGLLAENDIGRNVELIAGLGGTGELAGTEVSLGALIRAGTGVCRHRSLLFKVLADACGLPSALVRGNYMLPDGSAGGHAWNEVVLENGDRIVVDVMGHFIADLADPELRGYADLAGTLLYAGTDQPVGFPPPVADPDRADLDVIRSHQWVEIGGSAGRAAAVFLSEIDEAERAALVASLARLSIRADVCSLRQRDEPSEVFEVLRVRGASYLLLLRCGATTTAPGASDGPDRAPVDWPAQSLEYNRSHRISEDQPILFGLRDGGRHLQFDANGEPLGEQFREIMIARSPDEDPDLKAVMDQAIAGTAGLGSRLERADFLADLVADLLAEGDPERNTAILAAMGGEKGLAGVQVSLGELIRARTGVCRHRSLLFKVLADACGLPAALVRGNYMLPDGSAGGHAWNEIVLENGDRIVVDVMGRFIADLSDGALKDYVDMTGRYLYRDAPRPDGFPLPVEHPDESDLEQLRSLDWVMAGSPSGRAACIILDKLAEDRLERVVAALDRLGIKHDRSALGHRDGDRSARDVLRVTGASYLILARTGAAIDEPAAPSAPEPVRFPIEAATLPPASLLEAPGEPLAQRIRIVAPARILWTSKAGVFNVEQLLSGEKVGPVEPGIELPCILLEESGETGSVLLDFGRELNGSLEIGVTAPIVPVMALPRLRVRFGESVSEAMSELGDRASGNDYAVRDQIVTLPWKGATLVGPSGFRFVRLDLVDPVAPVPLRHVRVHAAYADQEPVGAFECSDPQLNAVWEVAAYTVQLNFQTYLWDGIKRDRLVWAGDIHPMVGTIQALFGPNAVLPRSLDFIRDKSPLDRWMNGICAFSLWWIIVQERWWVYSGDRAYLERQGDYLEALIGKIAGHVGEDGRERFDGGMRFIDWPSFGDEEALTEGLQALLVLALAAGERLLRALARTAPAEQCEQLLARARSVPGGASEVRSVRALRLLAGLVPEGEEPGLGGDDPRGLTAYLGYYVLEAMGRSGDMTSALALVRAFWGAMVDRGATSFWEEFDVEWLEGSGRIDELTPEGMRDIHGDTGRFGHAGFRKSLCHGWSAGPAAFLTEHVLGIRPLEPGCARVMVAPKLGDLDWARGRYPTPHGMISVHHRRGADGTVISQIEAPEGVEIVREEQAPEYL